MGPLFENKKNSSSTEDVHDFDGAATKRNVKPAMKRSFSPSYKPSLLDESPEAEKKQKRIKKENREVNREKNSLVDDPAILSALEMPGVKQLIDTVKGTGNLLSPELLELLGLEPTLDAVIHSDIRAAVLCDVLGAKAFAYRNEIFFSSGAFDPFSEAGKSLLTHELLHVAQQGGDAIVNRQVEKEEPQTYNIPADVIKDLNKQFFLIPAELRTKFLAERPGLNSVLTTGTVNDEQLDQESNFYKSKEKRSVRYEKAGEYSAPATKKDEILKDREDYLRSKAKEFFRRVNDSPESAIKCHDELKALPVAEREFIYREFPRMIERLEENLPADFKKSRYAGFDKANSNVLIDAAIKENKANSDLSKLLEKAKKPDTEYIPGEPKEEGPGIMKRLRGQHRGRMLSDHFTLEDPTLEGYDVGGMEFGKFDPGQKIQVSFNNKDPKKDGQVNKIADEFDKRDDKSKSLTGANYEIIADNFPLTSFNMFGAAYSVSTGALNTGKLVFQFFQEKKDKDGLTEGFMHVNIAKLNIVNLIFSSIGKEDQDTYAIGKLQATNLDFTVHKRFLLPGGIGERYRIMMSLFQDHLPAIFSLLVQQIMQLKQRMAGPDDLEKGRQERANQEVEVLAALSDEASTYVDMNIHWDDLQIDNFVSVGKDVGIIKSIKTGKTDIKTQSNNEDASLQDDKLKYKENQKELQRLRGKRMWKRDFNQKKIDEIEEKNAALKAQIDQKERSGRTMTAEVDVHDLSMDDGGYVQGMASNSLQESGIAYGAELGSIRKTDLHISSTSNTRAVESLSVDVKNIDISSLKLISPYYHSEESGTCFSALEGNMTDIVASFEVNYSDPVLKTKDSMSFTLKHIHAGHLSLSGPASLDLSNKTFASVEVDKKIELSGVDLLFKNSSFSELKIANIDNADVELPGMMTKLSNVSGKSISVKSVDSDLLACEGEEQQSKWIVDAGELSGKVQYNDGNNVANTDLSKVLVKGSYDQGTGRAYLEQLGSANDSVSLESISWKTEDGGFRIASTQPVVLSGLQLKEAEVLVNPSNPSDIQSITILSAGVREMTTHGLTINYGDQHLVLSDKESKISGLEIKNVTVAKDAKGSLGLTKAQLNASSVNLAPFVASAKDAWSANISQFTSGALSCSLLESGGIKYDVKNLDVKGKVSNKDKESSQSSDINIDTESLGGSYLSKMEGTDGDRHEVVTMENTVDIPSVALTKLKMNSPELQLDAAGSAIKNVKADFKMVITRPSENVKKRQKKEFQEMLDRLRKQPMRSPSEEKLLKEPTFEAASTIDLTIRSLSIDTAYLNGLEAKTTGDSKLNIVKEKVEGSSKDRTVNSYSHTTTEYKFNPGEEARINKVVMENFQVHVDDKNFDYSGKLSMGDEQHNALQAGKTSIVQNSLTKFLTQEGSDVTKQQSNSTMKSTAGGKIGTISFNGSSKGDFTFTVTDPALSLESAEVTESNKEFSDPTYPQQVLNMLGKKDPNTKHTISWASQELAARNGFNIFKASKVEVVRNAKENEDGDRDAGTVVVKLIDPTIAPIVAKGQLSEGALEAYNVLLQGSTIGTITIELLDGEIKSIQVPDLALSDISGELTMRESKSTEPKLPYQSEEEAFDEYRAGKEKRQNEFAFLSASTGDITLSMFGKELKTKLYNDKWKEKSIYTQEVTEYEEGGWVDMEEIVEFVCDAVTEKAISYGSVMAPYVSADVDLNGHYAVSLSFRSISGFKIPNLANGIDLFVLIPDVHENMVEVDPDKNWQVKEVIRLSALLDYQMNKPAIEDNPDPDLIDKGIDAGKAEAIHQTMVLLRKQLNDDMNFSTAFNLNVDLSKLSNEDPDVQAKQRGYLSLFKGNGNINFKGSMDLGNEDNPSYDPSYDKRDGKDPLGMPGLKKKLTPTLHIPELNLPAANLVDNDSLKCSVDSMNLKDLSLKTDMAKPNIFHIASKSVGLKNFLLNFKQKKETK